MKRVKPRFLDDTGSPRKGGIDSKRSLDGSPRRKKKVKQDEGPSIIEIEMRKILDKVQKIDGLV